MEGPRDRGREKSREGVQGREGNEVIIKMKMGNDGKFRKKGGMEIQGAGRPRTGGRGGGGYYDTGRKGGTGVKVSREDKKEELINRRRVNSSWRKM